VLDAAGGSRDHLGEPDPLLLQRAVADHVEQVRYDPVRDPELLGDAVEVLRDLLVRRDPPAEDVQRGLDDAERVAQVVPDRSDELPEGGEPLDARLLREQVVAVGVEHDRELEIEDLPERRARGLELAGVVVEPLPRDPRELRADDVHRGEHVVLRQADADVDAPDVVAVLPVPRVPGPGEQRVHPGDERDLQVPDPALAADERLARLLVAEDPVVEDLGDRLEPGRGRGVQRPQGLLVRRPEAHIAFELLEDGLGHAPRS
jgi:hypothetical protein